MLDLRKLYARKRAVSPVVAAILLIGLTVAAGAIVYFIVLPMLSSETTADDVEITFNANATNLAYKFYIKNSGSADIEIVTNGVSTDAAAAVANVTGFSPAKIKAGTTVEVTVEIEGFFIADTKFTFDFDDFTKSITVATADFGP